MDNFKSTPCGVVRKHKLCKLAKLRKHTHIAKTCEQFTLSASSISTFQSCRKRYEYEKIKHIYPLERPVALDFGSALHEGIAFAMAMQNELYKYDEDKLDEEFVGVKKSCVAQVDFKTEQLPVEDRVKAHVLMEHYMDKYWKEDVRDYLFIQDEMHVRMPLINPNTGKDSKRYFIQGYLDAVFRDADGALFIMEHKTSGQANDDYFERVNIDMQIAIYADLLSRRMGEKVRRVVYDVIKKPKHTMALGETDEEYEARKAASKTGKIKRKEAETEDEFYHRLDLAIDDSYFVRREYIITDERIDELRKELWSIANEMGHCKTYYKCTGNCLKMGTCPYMKLCCAGGNIEGLEGIYTDKYPARY